MKVYVKCSSVSGQLTSTLNNEQLQLLKQGRMTSLPVQVYRPQFVLKKQLLVRSLDVLILSGRLKRSW
jgi:uridine kinase